MILKVWKSEYIHNEGERSYMISIHSIKFKLKRVTSSYYLYFIKFPLLPLQCEKNKYEKFPFSKKKNFHFLTNYTSMPYNLTFSLNILLGSLILFV